MDVTPGTGGSVAASSVMVLAMDPGAPRDMAIDQDFVYWTSYDSGTLQRVAKNGGPAELLAQLRRDGAPNLDVDDTSVYFSVDDDSGSSRYVARMSKAGGTPTTIAAGQYGTIPLKVKDGFVYWLSGPGLGTQPLEVPARVSINGGAVQMLSSSTTAGSAKLVVDGAYVYWTAYGDLSATSGNVYRVPLDGSGPPTTLLSGIDSPYGIAVDSTSVFVGIGVTANTTDGHFDGAVLRVDKSANSPASPVVLADQQAQPFSLAVDDSYVYWGDRLSGYIMRAPKAGGAATPVVSGYGGFEAIAVDDQYVYWIFGSVGNGYVARANKNPQ